MSEMIPNLTGSIFDSDGWFNHHLVLFFGFGGPQPAGCFFRCARVDQLLILGMGDLPPLIGNPYNGYINPYYKVDDHPYHRKAHMGVDRPQHSWWTRVF